jgi:hypothetical protein
VVWISVERVSAPAEPEPITAAPAGVRPLTAGMRALLLLATALVLLAGLQLFVFSDRTQEWFAWTVNPPVTAAFLGAAYWASAVVELTSARAHAWADARVAVPSVFTFTTLTLVVTLVHLDKFHLGAEFAVQTQVVTWLWLAVYVLVPIAMAVLWLRQRFVPGVDPARTHPLATWLRAAIGAMAVVLLVFGAALLIAPEATAAWWPWDLTALTGRAIGAWLVGLGVAAAETVYEDDARRARPVAAGGIALAVLAAVALARYSQDVAWGTVPAVVVGFVLAAWALLGAAIIATERRSVPSP